MPQVPLGKESRPEKLTRTLFFLSAVLFHLVLFMAVAGYVLWPMTVPEPEPGVVYVAPVAKLPEIPPTPPVNVSDNVKTPTPDIPQVPVTISPAKFDLPNPVPGDSRERILTRTPGIISDPVPRNSWKERLPKIQHLEDILGRTPRQIAAHDPSCKFKVYVASYANGDWSCNTRLDAEGNIVAGAIPNLVAKISEWSHGTLKGEVIPKPLNIASRDLLDKMPPFIFFTGHKDFVLTQEEIDNLREYLFAGGAIWGDNALAGEGSRFDVAFKREMKRVIPDRDKNFVSYSPTDEIFTKGKFPLSQFPAGMNYYAEPPQHLDLDGVLAILYTPNDYSDMMFMRINPGDKDFFMTYQPIDPGTLYTNTAFVEKRSIFYRNFDLKSSLDVHHLGMDIITHLIIRFDPQLQLPP